MFSRSIVNALRSRDDVSLCFNKDQQTIPRINETRAVVGKQKVSIEKIVDSRIKLPINPPALPWTLSSISPNWIQWTFSESSCFIPAKIYFELSKSGKQRLHALMKPVSCTKDCAREVKIFLFNQRTEINWTLAAYTPRRKINKVN